MTKMKLGLLCVGAVLLSSCVVLPGQDYATGPAKIAMDIEAPSIEDRQSTQIIVYLPLDYEADIERLYPVTFFLHGWGSDAGAFERLGGIEAMNRLADAHRMIVVSVNGETSDYRNWTDGKSLWEDHLLGAISDAVDSNFRVHPHSSARGVYGVSMGGAASLRIAMTHPDKFGCAAAHSAAISPVEFHELPEWQRTGFLEMDDFADRYGDPFSLDAWKQTNPLHLVQTIDVNLLLQPDYYFDVGIDDQLGFAGQNAALSQALSSRGVPHTFILRVGNHGGAFVEDNIDSAMEFLANCFAEVE